jgi:hypothetical protein
MAAYAGIQRALATKKDLVFANLINEKTPCRFFTDNKAVFHQFNSPLIDSKLKWIQNKYLRALERVAEGAITVETIPTDDNISDIMTKGTIPYKKFHEFRKRMHGE